MTIGKEQGSGRAARAGRRPRCCAGGGGPLGALSKVQGRWEARGGRGPGANTGWRRRGERGTAVWGAGHPLARKSDSAGAGIERGRARGAARKPPSFQGPLPTSLTSSSIPLPLPGAHSPPNLCPGAVAGAGPGNPGSKPGHPRDAAGPGAACLPGAAVPGAGAARRAEPGAGRWARRGSSSPRRPPSPLLPDSVPSTKLQDAARLPLRFPLLPPPPLPQTEDAPWRLEACVSSGARESGICWRLRGSGRAGVRACARAPASVNVCECARARPRGGGVARGGGERPRDARRDRGKILCPRKSVKPEKEDRTRVSPGGAARGAAAEGEGKAARRAGSGSERVWAERSAQPRMQQRRCPQPSVALPPVGRGRAASSRHRRRCPDFLAVRGGTEIRTPRLPLQPWSLSAH